MSQLEEIKARHPADNPGHMCYVCDEYGCAERLSPYNGSDPSKGLARCDVAILLSAIEKLEAVAEVAREVYEADAAYWRTVGNPETTQREHVAAHAVALAAMVALGAALEGKPRDE